MQSMPRACLLSFSHLDVVSLSLVVVVGGVVVLGDALVVGHGSSWVLRIGIAKAR